MGACGPLGRAFTHGIRFFDVGEVVRVSAGHRGKLGLQPLDLLPLCAPKLSLTVMPAHAAKVCTSKRDRVGATSRDGSAILESTPKSTIEYPYDTLEYP